MGRTWRSVITALFLVGISLGIFFVRRATQGANIGGPPGDVTWKVTLVATGKVGARPGVLTMALPPDFRHQHIFDERFESKELLHRMVKAKDPARRHVAWRKAGVAGDAQARLTYSFLCNVGVRHPTMAMLHHARLVDATPGEGVAIKPAPGIESDHAEVVHTAREIVAEAGTLEDRIKACFDYVAQLENEPSVDSRSALECLRAGAGNPGSKSRLLVALCRSQNIPARLVGGLILSGNKEQDLHYWAEAWVRHRWLPMCPTYQHFGQREFPSNYLVWLLGDTELFRGSDPPWKRGFLVQAVTDSGAAPSSLADSVWQHLSLYSLRPAEQHVVRFLLLLPLAALIVSLFRTVIGVYTYGTFGPALLGLAFLDLKALRWGLAIFVATVLVGWAMRHLLDRFHLLLVPRTAALLTLIVGFLLLVIVLGSHYGISGAQYISLFPLVILTHMVERFWTVEVEDGTVASFKTLLGTMVVAVTVSAVLSPPAASQWLLHYPETLGVVLAAELLLGRYTGYRLSELYRFNEFLRNGNART
ncbi:MAG TPA: 7TM domain-containing protein [Gemmataceae bacterium]|nr:7TM domain-containing protein [Gemmataceae bacterium]